jgi:hypothetical protein
MELVEPGGGKLRLNLHAGQTKAWDSKARFVFIIAGTQSGKTSFGPWLFHKWIQAGGPGDYLAVTASYDLFKLKMLPEMKRVFCELLGWGDYQASDRVIVSKDGKSRIILRSAQAEGGLESATVKAAWLDECGQDDFRIESWEAVLRRLSLAQGRVLGTTTPYNLGWLKTQVFDRWRLGDKDYDVIQFRSTMNPAFPQAEYDRAKATMTHWKHAMFYDGEFSRPAGLIYEDFDESVHVVKPMPLDDMWPIAVGIDFGAVHTALVWLAEHQRRKTFYLFRESLTGGLSTPEHAKRSRDLAAGKRSVTWYGGSASETQQRMDWNAASVRVQEPPVGDVEAGIDRVIALLREKRLFVFDTCQGIKEEFMIYSRELDASGLPTEKIANKETFHRLDALRYVVSGVTSATGGRARVREY